MNLLTILFISLGLGADAVAVSITGGAKLKKLKISTAVKTGVFFGGFQAFMPFLGWLAGINLRNFISSIDHWIAFLLLGFIGLKMIYGSFGSRQKEINLLSNKVLFFLAIATSIDAFVVGISFAFLKLPVFISILIIGFITFLLSFAGVAAGNRLNFVLKDKIELAGGIILIVIGLKILISHLF